MVSGSRVLLLAAVTLSVAVAVLAVTPATRRARAEAAGFTTSTSTSSSSSSSLSAKSIEVTRVEASVLPVEMVAAVFCPNNCSYPNGQCTTSTGCVCNPGWGNLDCGTVITDVALNTEVQNQIVYNNTWALYHVNIPANTYVEVQMNMVRTSAVGDPDLYVRKGMYPLRNRYDYADLSTDDEHGIVLTQTDSMAGGDWFIGVYGYGEFNAVFNVEVDAWHCPGHCSDNGQCDMNAHTCTCNQGWTGADCSSQLRAMFTPIDVEYGRLEPLDWVYFHLVVGDTIATDDFDFNVTVTRTDNSQFGYLDLFIRRGAPPSDTAFDLRSQRTDSINRLVLCSSQINAGTYYVALRNWGFEAINYHLVAEMQYNCPNFCSTHGTCVPQQGCVCQSGFFGSDCSVDQAVLLSGTITSGAAAGVAILMILLGVAIGALVWHFFGARIGACFSNRFRPAGSIQGDFTHAAPPPTVPAAAGTRSYQTIE